MDPRKSGHQRSYFAIGFAAALLVSCRMIDRPALGQAPPPPPPMMQPNHGPPPESPWSGDNLQLSPDQKAKFTALAEQAQQARGSLYKQLHDLRNNLSAVYGEYQLDARKARALNDELNKVQAQLLEMHLQEQQKLRAILTPDQFNRLQAQIHQQREEERQQRHGPGDHEWPH